MINHTPNGKPRNTADEIANARAYAKGQEEYISIRADMMRDAQDDGIALVVLVLFSAVLGLAGVVVWIARVLI